MIILALSAMIGTSKIMAPYLKDLSQTDDAERFQQLASHILLNTGTPTNWGQIIDTAPTSLGLARADSLLPYELDIDKVSRLNSRNSHTISYAELWEALGAQDVAFQIDIKPLFELSVSLVSNSSVGSQTVYEFEVAAKKSGMPLATSLNCYVVIKGYVNETMSSTTSNGVGSLSISVPNSVNGTALLLVFARGQMSPQIVSFTTYAFGHKSPFPLPNGTFTRLIPLNHVLNASLASSATQILKAQIFSFSYNFSLTEKAAGVQTEEYLIPQLLDSSPMIMVLTGYNGSTSFTEWVSYPQLPLQTGVDFNQSTAGSKIFSLSHIVTINSALYEVVTKWGGLG
jgi:hypothetical protein